MKLGIMEDDPSSTCRVGPVDCARRTEDKTCTTLEAEFGMSVFGFTILHFEASSRAMLHAEFTATALALYYFDVIPFGRDHFDEVF